jgi:hypothetical protein
VPFWRPQFRKFPVFFPVSREFHRRKVSARLRAPPRSPECREMLPSLPASSANYAHFSRFLLYKSDWREWTARHGSAQVSSFFLEPQRAVRLPRVVMANVRRSKIESSEGGLGLLPATLGLKLFPYQSDDNAMLCESVADACQFMPLRAVNRRDVTFGAFGFLQQASVACSLRRKSDPTVSESWSFRASGIRPDSL